MILKAVRIVRGRTPYSSGSVKFGPYIVNVFPEAVYPYVKTVPLKPYITDSMMDLAAESYTSFYVLVVSKTWSNSKSCLPICSVRPPFLRMLMQVDWLAARANSSLMKGRTRHTTFTFCWAFLSCFSFACSILRCTLPISFPSSVIETQSSKSRPLNFEPVSCASPMS